MTPESFSEYLARLQAGDEAAWGDLLHRYDDWIRDWIRAWINDHGLRREVDSADVRQSIFADFFRLAPTRYGQLRSMTELRRLLLVLSLNRLRNRARRRRPQPLPDDGSRAFAARDPSPSQHAELHEGEQLLEEFRNALTPELRDVFGWKEEEGLTWPEVGQRCGLLNPQAVHALEVRYHRALARVARQFELVED